MISPFNARGDRLWLTGAFSVLKTAVVLPEPGDRRLVKSPVGTQFLTAASASLLDKEMGHNWSSLMVRRISLF